MGVTPPAPQAAGTRIGYAEIPARVRTWVEQTLGSPVVATAEQVGGMSPGCATRLRCADGTRAFVKAVGPELNARTPHLFRHEVRVLEHIGADPLWARLLVRHRIAADATGPASLVAFRATESARFLEGARRRLGVG